MQDLLGLDGSARMNQPSTLGKNWKWRALEDELFNPSAEDFLRRKTVLYQRCR
jgi:4-alpha-glucanotransferase